MLVKGSIMYKRETVHGEGEHVLCSLEKFQKFQADNPLQSNNLPLDVDI